MELTCAYIFLLFSVISATPHGYGTKGGASAKAEAIATAGAFDGVRGLPLTIPSGPGFSGSFSKSSSSSFSSASSSASASSSSYSYSGSGSSGLHGFGSNSVAGANGFGEGNGLAGTKSIAGSQGLAGANAFAGSNAIAGSNGLAGTNALAGAHGLAGSNGLAGANGIAEGNSLAGGISGCESGACSHNKADVLHSHQGSDTAATGHGNTGSNAAATSNSAAGTYGLANGGGNACVGNDCSHPSSACEGPDCLSINQNKKCSSGNCEDYQSPTQCTSGQCGLNAQTNQPTTNSFGPYDIPVKQHHVSLKPDSKDHYTHNSFNGYNGASSNSNTQSSQGINSLHHSGNYNNHNQLHGVPTTATSPTNDGLSIDHSKPATYLTTPKVEEPCNSPSCKFGFGESAAKPTSYNVPLHTSTDVSKQNLPCNNGNCGNNQFPTSSVAPLPSGPSGPKGCTSPSCAAQPSFSPTTGCTSTHCAPNYSHLTSVPQSSGSGINYAAGSIPNNPSYASPVIPSYNPSQGHFKPACSTPDCTGYTPGYINTESNSGAPSHGGFLPDGTNPTKPSYSTPVLIPSTPTIGYHPNTPSNAGNYGGVSGTTAHAPGHVQPTGGFGGPSGILKPNEFSIPSNTHVVPSHTGPSIAINPSVETSPSVHELPPYTGGFGAPHGILKPNEFDIKQPSATHNLPASSGSPTGHNIPAYTGGFGAPSGLLKPNEINSSAKADASANSNGGSLHTSSPNAGVISPVQNVPTAHGSHVAPLGTLRPGIDSNVGIPAVHLTTPVVLQPIPVIYPTHHALPTGSVQPNAYYSTTPIGSSVVAGGNIDSHGHHGHTQLQNVQSVLPSTVNKDLPKYTGSFGGADGVLKPNDFKDSSNTGYNKPGTISSSKPVPCSSATCNIESSNAAAAASADAVAYSSGFGGPPGLLIPHDGGKLDHKLLSGAQFGLHQGAPGSTDSGIANGGVKTPAHDSYSQSGGLAQANAVAQAGATAEATSGSFGGSSGQTEALGGALKSGSGCGGGCGGGNYHSSGHDFGSSSAISNAKAGVLHGPDSGLHGDGSSAKSVASAVSGARAFGGAGNYASSSASAHASAGYATKGGYGK